MKIKLESIQDQAQLDEILENYKKEIQERSKSNYEDAAQRTATKYDALRNEQKNYIKTIKELENKNLELTTNHEKLMSDLENVNKANDTFAMSEILKANNVNSKYHELLINSTGINSNMDDEEITNLINQFGNEYPEMMVNERQPSKTPPAPAEEDKKPEFDMNKTYM